MEQSKWQDISKHKYHPDPVEKRLQENYSRYYAKEKGMGLILALGTVGIIALFAAVFFWIVTRFGL